MTRCSFALVLFGIALDGCVRPEGSTPRWSNQASAQTTLRVSARGEVLHQPRAERTRVGEELAVGAEMRFSIHPELNRLFFGEAMGLEARGRYLPSVAPTGAPPSFQAGLAFTSYVLLGRARVAAPFAILIPETGYASQGSEHGLSLRWSAPVAVLLNEHVSAELAPSVTLLDPAPRREANWMFGVGLGIGWRESRKFRVRDPGYYVVSEYTRCSELETNLPMALAGASAALDSARPYRRYLAVTRVGEALPHFALSYAGADAPVVLAAARDNQGQLRLAPDPATRTNGTQLRTSPVPPELRELAAAVVATFRRDCRIRADRVDYVGTHRDIVVEELVLLGPAHQSTALPRGFRRRHRLVLNGDLTLVLARDEFEHTPALLDVPPNASWLPSSGAPSGKLSEPSQLPAELDGEVLRAAREVETGRPRPLATLVPASEPIVPTPFVTHLRVSLTLSQNLKSAPTAANAESHTSVELGSAVFAEGSSGGSEVSLEGERYRVQVRLSTDTPSDPANGYRTETYRGKLEVRVEDEHGRSFRRILPVSGLVELDGPGAIAAMGLEVPMYLSSDEEQNPRLGALEERGPLPRVQILVSSVLTAEEFE